MSRSDKLVITRVSGSRSPAADEQSKKLGTTSGWNKFLLLMWKNWTVQKRHVVQILAELLLPVVFVSLLVIIRDLVTIEQFPDVTSFPPYKIGPNLPRIPNKPFLVFININS